mmetsp:Transcript_18773/g.36834  ORF Transcript_18773/g.36834 Transcript_18773/m.36834 type:complete len:144 (+) Transcript_18773:20-451(+)
MAARRWALRTPRGDTKAEGLPMFVVENPDGTLDSMVGAHSVPPPRPSTWIVCFHCRATLELVVGKSYLKCGKCRSVNLVRGHSQVGERTIIVVCPNCDASNAAPHTTMSLRCGNCNAVLFTDFSWAVPQRRRPVSRRWRRRRR